MATIRPQTPKQTKPQTPWVAPNKTPVPSPIESPRNVCEITPLIQEIPSPAKINLIPFNPFPGTDFKRSSAETIRHFQERLRKRGLVATTRKTRGDDIDAACGQLVGDVTSKKRSLASSKRVD